MLTVPIQRCKSYNLEVEDSNVERRIHKETRGQNAHNFFGPREEDVDSRDNRGYIDITHTRSLHTHSQAGPMYFKLVQVVARIVRVSRRGKEFLKLVYQINNSEWTSIAEQSCINSTETVEICTYGLERVRAYVGTRSMSWSTDIA